MPAPKKKQITIPSAYPNDASARPQVLKKGRPALNPQATKLGTAADAAVGSVLGGLQNFRTPAQEKQNMALRGKDPGAAIAQDVKGQIKRTADFYRTSSPAPQMTAKGKAAAAKLAAQKKRSR